MLDHAPPETSRAKRLLAATKDQHELLDASVSGAELFADLDGYAGFVRILHGFHRDIDALYFDPRLGELIPDLPTNARLRLIEQDLTDLGFAPADYPDAPLFDHAAHIDLPTALGWLYVAEGSKLGAALLLKRAEKLGLSESFGARHLAAAPEGRGLHWKTFIATVDGVKLTDHEEEQVIMGGRAAFARVQQLVDDSLSQSRE